MLFRVRTNWGGKTYMFGPPGDDAVGIIPRAVNDVFQRLVQIQEDKETAVVVSFWKCTVTRYEI